MKTPASAGLPAAKFPAWRKGQDRALRDLLFSPERFNVLCIPTGGGKTVVGMGYAGVDDGRVAYLTATRALQDQVYSEFSAMGLVDMRGRSNYTCNIDERVTAADAVCTGGVYCALMKSGGCDYYDAMREARASRLVVTNYRFWLHAEESGSLGEFSTVILDEAHRAPDEISDFAAVEIDIAELARFRIGSPDRDEKPADWASRALYTVEDAALRIPDLATRKKARDLQRKLARLCRLGDEEWLASRPSRYKFRWDLIDPGRLAEELLFRSARRIILVSASVRRKTLATLGVAEKVKVTEQESTFPVRRRPIYYWPIAKVGRGMSDEEKTRWLEGMDEWMGARLDRNGVVHCHSYDWGKQIYEASRHKDRMILQQRGEDGGEVLERFIARGRRTPVILVSPAVGTGVDFAGRIAEWQIIAKVPFPDMSAPLVKARMKRDRDYISYVTMQSLVQIAGRVMRGEDDAGETMVVDWNFGWMRAAHWDFAPRYFHAAVKTVKARDTPPPPPPPLPRRSR